MVYHLVQSYDAQIPCLPLCNLVLAMVDRNTTRDGEESNKPEC